MGNSIHGYLRPPCSNITAQLNQPVINLLSENPDAYPTVDLIHTTEKDYIIILESGGKPKKVSTDDLTVIKTTEKLDTTAKINSYQFVKRT